MTLDGPLSRRLERIVGSPARSPRFFSFPASPLVGRFRPPSTKFSTPPCPRIAWGTCYYPDYRGPMCTTNLKVEVRPRFSIFACHRQLNLAQIPRLLPRSFSRVATVQRGVESSSAPVGSCSVRPLFSYPCSCFSLVKTFR